MPEVHIPSPHGTAGPGAGVLTRHGVRPRRRGGKHQSVGKAKANNVRSHDHDLEFQLIPPMTVTPPGRPQLLLPLHSTTGCATVIRKQRKRLHGKHQQRIFPPNTSNSNSAASVLPIIPSQQRMTKGGIGQNISSTCPTTTITTASSTASFAATATATPSPLVRHVLLVDTRMLDTTEGRIIGPSVLHHVNTFTSSLAARGMTPSSIVTLETNESPYSPSTRRPPIACHTVRAPDACLLEPCNSYRWVHKISLRRTSTRSVLSRMSRLSRTSLASTSFRLEGDLEIKPRMTFGSPYRRINIHIEL